MVTKILIADDEPAIRELLRATFQDERWALFVAADGDEALQIALREKPDIALLDVVMPKRSGWDVCELIKRDSETSHTYVIMVSALVNQSHKRRAFLSGADAYQTKPFSPAEVLKHINSIVSTQLAGARR